MWVWIYINFRFKHPHLRNIICRYFIDQRLKTLTVIEKNHRIYFDVISKLQSISLITTLKEWHMLVDFVLRYFKVNRKYFYVCIILGDSSFKWCKIRLSLKCNSGVISGLRKWSVFVVIRVHFPNNNSKPILRP
jgi:hypothetical protein